MKVKDLTESQTQTSKEVEDFIKSVKDSFLKEFPKAWFDGSYSRSFKTIDFEFGIQPKSKHANHIARNDPSHHKLIMHDIIDGEFPEKSTMEMLTGGALYVKPEEGSHLAMGSVKIGYRKKTGTPAQIVKHLQNYFKKMKKVVNDNKDNLIDDIS